MKIDDRIFSLIPHRSPFLWVDRIVHISPDRIETEKTFPQDLDVFAGHYPGNPLMPGVLLCEAIFQSGALLLAELIGASEDTPNTLIPVLTRIKDTRFKRRVLPGDTMAITVRLIDTISSVCVLKGTAKVAGETAVKTEFYCALIAP